MKAKIQELESEVARLASEKKQVVKENERLVEAKNTGDSTTVNALYKTTLDRSFREWCKFNYVQHWFSEASKYPGERLQVEHFVHHIWQVAEKGSRDIVVFPRVDQHSQVLGEHLIGPSIVWAPDVQVPALWKSFVSRWTHPKHDSDTEFRLSPIG